MIESLQAQVVKLRAEVEELRARLNRDSSNSSQPPSSKPLWKSPADRKKGRKRGGQPGHGGRKREFVTPDLVEDHRPTTCSGCGESLTGDDRVPFRHQVTEIPEVVAVVTEHRVHTLQCNGCGQETAGDLPRAVPWSSFGPRLQAMVAVCSGGYRLSKRSTRELLRDFFGVRISLGAISNIEQYVSAALEGPMLEAIEHVKRSRAAYVDETGWLQRACRAWLWVAVTARVALFFVRPRRTKATAIEILGRWFVGVSITDRYPGYDWIAAERHQFCWAHLIRDYRGLLDYESSRPYAEQMLTAIERMFAAWHGARLGTTAEVAAALAPSQREIHELLVEGSEASDKRLRQLSRALLKREASLWTFVRRHDVEPTNNIAERALRHAVLWRKSSLGTDSDKGSRFAERILTVVSSLRLQGRRVLAYVADACARALSGSHAHPLWHP